MKGGACAELSARLNDAMQRPPGRTESIDTPADGGILVQRGRMVRFDACVNDQGAPAAPVLLQGKRVNTMHVGRRIGAREGDPQEIVQGSGSEGAIVNNDDQGERVV